MASRSLARAGDTDGSVAVIDLDMRAAERGALGLAIPIAPRIPDMESTTRRNGRLSDIACIHVRQRPVVRAVDGANH